MSERSWTLNKVSIISLEEKINVDQKLQVWKWLYCDQKLDFSTCHKVDVTKQWHDNINCLITPSVFIIYVAMVTRLIHWLHSWWPNNIICNHVLMRQVVYHSTLTADQLSKMLTRCLVLAHDSSQLCFVFFYIISLFWIPMMTTSSYREVDIIKAQYLSTMTATVVIMPLSGQLMSSHMKQFVCH